MELSARILNLTGRTRLHLLFGEPSTPLKYFSAQDDEDGAEKSREEARRRGSMQPPSLSDRVTLLWQMNALRKKIQEQEKTAAAEKSPQHEDSNVRCTAYRFDCSQFPQALNIRSPPDTKFIAIENTSCSLDVPAPLAQESSDSCQANTTSLSTLRQTVTVLLASRRCSWRRAGKSRLPRPMHLSGLLLVRLLSVEPSRSSQESSQRQQEHQLPEPRWSVGPISTPRGHEWHNVASADVCCACREQLQGQEVIHDTSPPGHAG
eukprot:768605-Hanusia_phi.AAC.6